MTKGTKGLIAGVAALAVGVGRFRYETSLAALVPYDAQGGIWYFHSIIMSGLTAIAIFVLCYLALEYLTEHHLVWGGVTLLILLGVGGCTARSMLRIHESRCALIDSQDPAADPERLRALVGYESGFGYEVDNRLASNPGTPADVLRVLHARPDQVGTEASLAMNPNTPDDILREFAESEDEYIQKALKRNPRYLVVIGDGRDAE